MTDSYTLHGGPGHGERVTLPRPMPFLHWQPRPALDLSIVALSREPVDVVFTTEVYELVSRGPGPAYYRYVEPEKAAGPEDLPAPG